MHTPGIYTTLKIKNSILRNAAAMAVLTLCAALPARAALPGMSSGGDDTAKIETQTEAAHKALAVADASLLKIADQQVRVQRLVDRLHDFTTQLKSNNQAIAGLQKLQPTDTLAKLDKAASAAKGSGDAPWMPGDPAIASLAGMQKNVADFQQKIQEEQANRANLDKQRNEASAQAETLSRKADITSGKAGLEVFRQASAQRKAASDLSAHMDESDAKLALLKRELAGVQAQQAVVEAAVGRLADLTKQTSAGWDSIQKQVQAYTDLSKLVVEGAGAQPPADSPPTTVAAAVAQLDTLSTALKDERARADSSLTTAISAFSQAGTAAIGVVKQAGDNLSQHPEAAQAPVWKSTQELFSTAGLAMQKGQAELRQAQLYAAQAYDAGDRAATLKELKAALDEAKISVPALTADMISAPLGEKTDNVEKARKVFEAADKDLDRAGTPAKVVKVIEQYAHGLLLRANSFTKEADEQISAAKALASDLASANVALPALPMEIAPSAEKTATSGTTPPVADTAGTTSGSDEAQVKEVLNTFVSSILNGDSAKFKEITSGDADSQLDAQTHIDFVIALKKLVAAIKAKFPTSAMVQFVDTQMSAMSTGMQQMAAQAKIVINGDNATVSDGPDDKSPQMLKKVDGHWKMIAPPNSSDKSDREKEAKTAAAFSKLADDLTAGKFPTEVDFAKAMMQMAADSGMPLGAPATSPAATDPAAPK